MDLGTSATAARFDVTEPPLGRAKAGIVVEGATVTIDAAVLKRPIAVPLSNVIAVDLRPDGPPVPVLRREPKEFRLGVGPYAPANLVLVFRQPVPFGRTTWGSNQVTGITDRERRRGLAVDAVVLSLADPDAAIAALRVRGAGHHTTVGDALVEVIGAAEGLELERRLDEVLRARGRALAKVAVASTLMAIALPLRFAVGSDLPAGRLVHIGAASVLAAVWACVATLALAGADRATPLPSPPYPHARRSVRRQATRDSVRSLLMLGAYVAALFGAARLTGLPQVVVLGTLFGSPPGIALGTVWRAAINGRSSPGLPDRRLGLPPVPPIGPVPLPSPGGTDGAGAWVGGPISDARTTYRRSLRRRVGIGVGISVAVVLGLVVVALVVGSISPTADDDLAGRATVTEDDLPPGWTAYRADGPLERGVLDDHICGNAPGSLPDHTGAYGRDFGYQIVDEMELASLDLSVLMSPSVSDAEAEFAAALDNGPEYQRCVIDRAIQIAAVGSPEETGTPSTSTSRSPMSTPSMTVDRIVVETPTVAGLRRTHIAFVRMQVGRAIIRMPVTTWGLPMVDSELTPIIEVVRRRADEALLAPSG